VRLFLRREALFSGVPPSLARLHVFIWAVLEPSTLNTRGFLF
jgi:hypothetical protein